jgi:hypothetical protein
MSYSELQILIEAASLAVAIIALIRRKFMRQKFMRQEVYASDGRSLCVRRDWYFEEAAC